MTTTNSPSSTEKHSSTNDNIVSTDERFEFFCSYNF